MIPGLSPQPGHSNKHMHRVYTQMCFDWIQAGAPWLPNKGYVQHIHQIYQKASFYLLSLLFSLRFRFSHQLYYGTKSW